MTYTRLGRLFLNEGYCDLAILKYKKALKNCIAINDTTSISYTYKSIGNAYQLDGESDSALYYYNSSLKANPDLTNKLDLEKNIAQILFEKGEKDSAYIMIKRNLEKLDNYRPIDSYYGILGKMYYDDKIYDTAIYYLKLSLNNTNYKHTIINSSNYLSLIYDIMEDDEMKAYYDSISLQALYEINNSSVNRNRIQYIYKDYCDRKQENKQMEMRRSNTKYLIYTLLFVISLVIFILIIWYRSMRDKKFYNKEICNKNNILENKEYEFNEIIEGKNRFILDINNELDEITHKYKEQNLEIDKLKKKTDKISRANLKDFQNCDNCKKILENIDVLKKEKLKISNLSPLTSEELSMLLQDTDLYMNNYIQRLSAKYTSLKKEDLYCISLLLLDISAPTIAVLLGKSYNATWNRIHKIYSILGIDSEAKLYTIFR